MTSRDRTIATVAAMITSVGTTLAYTRSGEIIIGEGSVECRMINIEGLDNMVTCLEQATNDLLALLDCDAEEETEPGLTD